MLRAFLLPLRLFFAVSLLALLMGGAQAQDVQPLPPLAAHVTDTVGLLSVDRREAIEARLVALEREKGAQVAVLLVATTRPEAIEEYALRVAEAVRLGRKGVDDGVLFVVARDDRRMRIEVGRGLEGAIPDAIAKRIIADVVTPYFKAGDFPQARDYFTKDLQRQPHNAEFHFGMAAAYIGLGDLKHAREHFAQAREESITADARALYSAKLDMVERRIACGPKGCEPAN